VKKQRHAAMGIASITEGRGEEARQGKSLSNSVHSIGKSVSVPLSPGVPRQVMATAVIGLSSDAASPCSDILVDRPRSPILRSPVAPFMNMLSHLMSLWITCCVWRNSRPWRICRHHRFTAFHRIMGFFRR
jgi:hypothetical protein